MSPHPLPTEPYLSQSARWPQSGRHVMAHQDAETLIVYQAYRPAIGLHAIRHGRLDGPHFSLQRMSWIKPNFLWMMYRSGWGTKEGQEVTLGLRIRRAFFDRILRDAVASSFDPASHASREAWEADVANSEIRLQWDPDHTPSGAQQERRAVQLGLRGATLAAFAGPELLEVIDMRDFVATQRPHAQDDSPALLVPVETPYVIEPQGVIQ